MATAFLQCSIFVMVCCLTAYTAIGSQQANFGVAALPQRGGMCHGAIRDN